MLIRDSLLAGDASEIERVTRATGYFSDEEVAIARSLVCEALAQGDASGYIFAVVEEVTCELASTAEVSRAKSANETLGYACFGPIPATQSSYDLYWIVVAPASQRQGLGLALLRHVERRVAELCGKRLYVDTSSRAQYAPTQAFYERAGYRRAAFFDDFYAPGDGKIVYVKAIG